MSRRRFRALSIAVAVASVPLALPSSARSASPSWASPTSGLWLTDANWSTGTAPAPGDTVTLNAPGTYTVTLDGFATVGPVTLNAPSATLAVVSPTSYFNTGAFSVSAGTLAIRSAGQAQIHLSSASFTNAGTVTFDTDFKSSVIGTVFADIATGSGNVVNSGLIEAHTAPSPTNDPGTTYYAPVYSFTGSAGKTFTNTGTLRTVGASAINLYSYTLNQNAGALDGSIQLFAGALNYNGGSCSPTTSVYLQNSPLKIAPSATAGNFLLAVNGTLTSNIPAGNTVTTYGTTPTTWTAAGSTFTNAGRLAIGYIPGTAPSTTTASPSFSVGSSTNTLLNTGTLELNNPNVPAATLTGSVTNQGTLTVNAPNNAYSNVPTRLSGSFTQNAGGSLTIDPSTSLSLTNNHFYLNAGTVAGTVSLNNSTVHFAPGLANAGAGTFTYSTSSNTPAAPFAGNIPAGATVAHVAPTSVNAVIFNLPSFSNAGALRTSAPAGASYSPQYRLNDTAGTLTNTGSLGGTVNGADRGIALLVDGNLTNTGDVKAYDLTVNGGSFNQNAGTLNVDTYCAVTGDGTFYYNGGTLTGKPVGLNNAALRIAPNTNPASFQFYAGTCAFSGSPVPGSTLALDPFANPANITVNAAPFTNAGTLLMAASVAAATSTLTVTGSGALANTGTLSVTQGQGGTRTLNAHVANSGTFSVGPGATLTLVGTLTTSAPLDLQGTLDLRGTLTWTTPTPTAADTLRTLLSTNHLTNSTADARHRLAYIFSGDPTAPTSLTVSLALTGDANFDGKIDADDYALIDRGFATTGSYWWQGDFDYDGQVTSADYLLIDTSYAQTHPLSPALLSQREQQFGADYVSQLLTSIPEPSSLACLFAALPLLSRRRTKS